MQFICARYKYPQQTNTSDQFPELNRDAIETDNLTELLERDKDLVGKTCASTHH